jgi:hypothetical protein
MCPECHLESLGQWTGVQATHARVGMRSMFRFSAWSRLAWWAEVAGGPGAARAAPKSRRQLKAAGSDGTPWQRRSAEGLSGTAWATHDEKLREG